MTWLWDKVQLLYCHLQANEQHEEAVDTIINVTDRLFSSVGDAQEMVKQAKQLAQVGKSFVSVLCPASSVDR